MNRALQVTLLLLAVLAVMFAVTWVSMKSVGVYGISDAPSAPASWFVHGLREQVTSFSCDGGCVNGRALQRRVEVVFGMAALVVVLIGLAFGAGRRGDRHEPTQ